MPTTIGPPAFTDGVARAQQGRTHRMVQPIAVALCVLAVSSGLTQSLQQPAESSRFRTGVDVVEVDVIVTAPDGEPVRGLTIDDFELFEDGRPVRVVEVQAVDLPKPLLSNAVSPSPTSEGTAIHDNLRTSEGGIYVILLDFEPAPGIFDRVRKTALAIIEGLGPTDLAAMMSTRGQRAYQVEFTSDRHRLARALERLVVGGQSMEPLPFAIERVAKSLSGIPSRRKAVALVSEGFYFDPKKPEYRSGIESVRRANVSVYAFDPRIAGSLDSQIVSQSAEEWSIHMEGDRRSVEALQTLAAMTNGRATVRTNRLDDGVQQMLTENRTYYLLRYHTLAPRDGKFHEISIRTKVPGLRVRSRPGFVALKAPNRERQPSPLDHLVTAPIQAPGLDMRVVAVSVPVAVRGHGGLFIVTELKARDVEEASNIEFTALLVDSSGRVSARDHYVGNVTHDWKSGEEWLRIASRFVVRPGSYQLRVAARRSDGRSSGSVFTEVRIPSFSDDFGLSGLFLTRGSAAGIVRAELLDRLLDAPPMAATEFPAQEPLSAALLLQVAPRQGARQVRLRAVLIAPDGTLVEVYKSNRSAADFTRPSGQLVEWALPADLLVPGSYKLRIEATLEDKKPLLRVIEFSVGGRDVLPLKCSECGTERSHQRSAAKLADDVRAAAPTGKRPLPR